VSFHVVDLLLFASEDAYVLCEQQTRLSLEVAMDQAFGKSAHAAISRVVVAS